MKDDHNEVGMSGQEQKPSIWAIAGIFATAIVLVLLLLGTPKVGTFSDAGDILPTSAGAR